MRKVLFATSIVALCLLIFVYIYNSRVNNVIESQLLIIDITLTGKDWKNQDDRIHVIKKTVTLNEINLILSIGEEEGTFIIRRWLLPYYHKEFEFQFTNDNRGFSGRE